MKTKIHSSIPYSLMALLLAALPVLKGLYPGLFFPAFTGIWVLIAGIGGACFCVVIAFTRLTSRYRGRNKAKGILALMAAARKAQEKPVENDMANSGRQIARLTRNSDEDLKEINPDFSNESLKRLDRFLPVLLDEIETEEDALIRLGVAGAYLGETACRNFQWQWEFKADPALHQFSYMVSTLRKEGRALDPFALAADWMLDRSNLKSILEAFR